MKSRLILCGMALAMANISRGAYTPLAIQGSSYNADTIVEANATPRLTISTTASIDEGTNNYNATLFEQGRDTVNPGNGLPHAGQTFAAYDNANYSYQMAPSFSAPNGLLIDAAVTNGTFTVTTPQAYSKLSFIGLGGNGGDVANVIVHHQDGSTENGTFSIPDWFGGPTGIALIMGGRVNQVYNLNTETDGNSGDGLGNPRVYHREMTLSNTTSPVTSITFTYASGAGGAHSDIIAVSGALSSGSGTTIVPIPVTGYTYDFILETNAPQPGRVVSQTMLGGTNVFATDQSLDSDTDTGDSFYERGYNLNNAASGTHNDPKDDLTGTGLPHPSGFFTNSTGDHIYQMASDYTVANTIYINDVLTNDTITLATPTALSGLSFAGAAGGGPVVINYVVHHTGGATDTGSISIPDWFDNTAPVALSCNGRVGVDSSFFQNVNSGFPNVYETDIVLADTTDPVTSIYLENTNTASGRIAIFAVSGSAGALPPSISQAPVSVNNYVGSSVTFTSAATANAALSYQWQKGTNNVFVNISNGGEISGATTTVLTINPLGFADAAQYRMVATDVAGSADSGAAVLGAFSTNTDVTLPGDPITDFGGGDFGDSPVANAIDDNVGGTKWGMNLSGSATPCGCIITPSVGLTAVNGLRIYTANDSTGRDPADFELEGSVDGGSHYTLIASNSLALPDGRNTVAAGPDPLTQFVKEADFSNTNGYTKYRLTFHHYKGGNGQTQMQLGEIELLGVAVQGFYFYAQPNDYKVFQGGSASFVVGANNATTVSWYRTGTRLADGGNISGSQSSSLTVNPANFSDSADYFAVAYDGSHYITSSIAHLYVYSTNVDVTQPGDTITEFGDTTGTRYGQAVAGNVIDDTLTEWINGGSGPSAGAGFPPFDGPVGVIVTPSAGSTILAGIRFYPGQEIAAADPSSYTLEGSNDGSTYTTIASGPLSLPLARNSLGLTVDPTQASVQEILFSNTKSYTSYRLTFPNVVDPSTASFLSVGEVDLLGVVGTGTGSSQPVISSPAVSGGNLGFSGTGGTPNGTFEVLTNGNLAAPLSAWGTNYSGTFDVNGHFSVSLPVNTSAHLFYLIKTP